MRSPRDFAEAVRIARIANSMRAARNRRRPFDREVDDETFAPPTLFGLPVRVDPTLRPGEFRFENLDDRAICGIERRIPPSDAV